MVKEYLKSGAINGEQLRKKAWERILLMLKESIKTNDRKTFKASLNISTTREHLFDLMKTAIYYGNAEIVVDIFACGYDIGKQPLVNKDKGLEHESDIGYVHTPHIIYAACLNRMYC